MNILKKKFNKLTLKMQTYKEEIMAIKEDFSRDFDSIKNSIEKKADWESLKKGIGYF
jgi:hypothetical protein